MVLSCHHNITHTHNDVHHQRRTLLVSFQKSGSLSNGKFIYYMTAMQLQQQQHTRRKKRRAKTSMRHAHGFVLLLCSRWWKQHARLTWPIMHFCSEMWIWFSHCIFMKCAQQNTKHVDGKTYHVMIWKYHSYFLQLLLCHCYDDAPFFFSKWEMDTVA